MDAGHLSEEALWSALSSPPGEEPAHLAHLESCPPCRRRLEGLRRAEALLRGPDQVPEAPEARLLALRAELIAAAGLAGSQRPALRALRLRRWAAASVAAAAAVLLARQTGPWRRAPDAAAPAEAHPIAARWEAGPAPAKGVPLYVAEDAWVVLSSGARACREGGGVRLEAGSLAWIGLGSPLFVATPHGILRSPPGEPVEADISLDGLDSLEGTAAGAFPREVEAAGDGLLSVAVLRGGLRLERPGCEDILIAPGGAAELSPDGAIRLSPLPSGWSGRAGRAGRASAVVAMANPQGVSGLPGFLPFDRLGSGGRCWIAEVEVAQGASVGVVFRTGGGPLRLWHVGALDGRHHLRLLAREARAEVWVDGRLDASTDAPGLQFQDAPVESEGVLVWGSARVLSMEGWVLP